jgi:hypothetical protein
MSENAKRIHGVQRAPSHRPREDMRDLGCTTILVRYGCLWTGHQQRAYRGAEPTPRPTGVAMPDMRAAHHEEGHTSVACAEGFEVQHIRLTGPDDGYVDYEGRSDTPLVARLHGGSASRITTKVSCRCSEFARPYSHAKPCDPPEQTFIYAHEPTIEHLCESDVLRVVGLRPAQLVGDAPR